MATTRKFRIDVDIHNLLMDSSRQPVKPAAAKGLTLNHNLAYCYNDARMIKFVWTNLVKNRMKGAARSFED